jgi:acyl carrier protein phosphodiesterase
VNFLAHLYLAGDREDLIIGNFIADHIKGETMMKYNNGVRQGIIMHRAIDYYTDTHPVVKQSVQRLRPKYRKYSGVIVDMFYDHFLAKGWINYSIKSLKDFTESRYRVLFDNISLLPPRSQRILPYMANQNWLAGYAELDGLHSALSGMSRRTTFESNMELAINDLSINYVDYKNEFEEFFPDLCLYAEREFASIIRNRL